MIFRPTKLAQALLLVIAFALVLGIALGRPELFAVALPLLVALLPGTRRGSNEVPQVVLTGDAETRFEGEELAITISARLPAVRGVVQIIPVLPTLFRPLGARRSPDLVSRGGQPLSWRCRARCEAAGILHFDAVVLRLFDFSGLWAGEWQERQRFAVTVLPRALPVTRLPPPRHTGALFGAHASPASGAGVAFAEIRPFAAGDRLREINWPVSLRRRVLHTNRFHTDRQAEVVLLIDTFTVIGERPHSSLDHVLRAAAGIAAAVLRRHDRVGLLEYGGIARSAGSGTGEGQYLRILHALARSAPLQTEFAQDLAALPEQVLSRRAFVLALTPLADQRFERAVIRLAQRGQDVALLALMTDELSAGLVRPRDLHPLVRRLWRVERAERLRALRRVGVRASNWSTAAPLDSAMGNLLAESHALARRAA